MMAGMLESTGLTSGESTLAGHRQRETPCLYETRLLLVTFMQILLACML